jgi:hypothetical protein
MNDLHELDVRINAAGESATAMNQAVVDAVKRGVDLEVFRPFIVPLAEHGLRLAAIQAWSEAAKAAQRAPTLAPGLVVGDVNGADEPVGHGGVDPRLCTPGNWSYYQQHRLGPRWAEIFSGSLSDMNAAIGARPGDLTTAQQDPLVRDAGGNVVVDLSTFG